MKFVETAIPGVLLVEIERMEDERGFFARTWCESEFAAQGITVRMKQCSLSYNHLRGTLRGMHYQGPPSAEAKLVRCNRGAVYDVLVDARENSPTEGRHLGLELTQDRPAMIYVPEGVAHGFITLTDGAELAYWISADYRAEHQVGFRWDDPQIGIGWPLRPVILSSRDAALPSFRDRNRAASVP